MKILNLIDLVMWNYLQETKAKFSTVQNSFGLKFRRIFGHLGSSPDVNMNRWAEMLNKMYRIEIILNYFVVDEGRGHDPPEGFPPK